ncbi:MAG: zinc-ribbon domain-containing protein [Deltaproteobacteria bacterium]|nr:zinc-ribbon domain-containing protein [Deltaproteobacteria bacterium]
MALRIGCQKCNAEYKLPDEKIPDRPSRFACQRCGQEIILVPGANGVEVSGGKVLSEQRLDLPDRFGQFFDLQRLASGGMGDVYLAKQGGTEGFEREVILKVLHQHLAREERFVQAMVDEAKLTVTLNHPNIVQMFNLERIDNQLCCVMEYVPGKALSAVMRSFRRKGGRMPVHMALYITHQVLEGLAYAHELKDKQGEPLHIVHRDISPQNIMVTKDGWVKVIDFGIAKAASRLTHTRTGTVKGKFAYMAPEQYEGKVDQRADIWAVGVVLWESLAATRLFRGKSDAATMQRVLSMTPPPVHSVRPDCPEAIDEVLVRALTKDPKDRYQSARNFKNDLLKAVMPITLDEMRDSIDIDAESLGEDRSDALADQLQFDSTTPPSLEFGTGSMETSDGPTRSYEVIDESAARPTRPAWMRVAGLGVLALLLAAGASFGVIYGLPWLRDKTDRDGDGPGPRVEAPDAGEADGASAPPADTGPSPADESPQAADTGSSPGADSQKIAYQRPIKLSRERIERTLRRYGGALQRCADKNLSKDGKTDVKLKLRFSVARNGAVEHVQIQPRDIEPTAFGRCLLGQVKRIRFPRHRDKSVSISIPLQFKVVK